MIKVNEAIIVEGKYDKIKLSKIVEGLIIEANGFRIFKDSKKLNLIKNLAKSRGVIILTDSDSAGFIIRNYLCSAIKDGKVFHAYIPEIEGKEKRKIKPSKENKLGVEGIPENLIEKAIKNSCHSIKDSNINFKNKVKEIRLKLYESGYLGNKFSSKKRDELKKELELPYYISTNALIQFLCKCFTIKEIEKIIH